MNHLCETWRFCHNKYVFLYFMFGGVKVFRNGSEIGECAPKLVKRAQK